MPSSLSSSNSASANEASTNEASADEASPVASDESDPAENSSGGSSRAVLVAAGIFASRIAGFIRERALAFFFGTSAHADALQVAFRAPNLLQNLLGEGTISAAFIPIYSRMLEEGRRDDAARFAGAIFGLLLLTAGGISLLGVLLAEPIVALLAPGYMGDPGEVAAGTRAVDRFGLAVQAVRILFPMTGVLVLSAWALGILNSHRRFFVSYVAPVLWNAAIIGGLVTGAVLLTGRPWTPSALDAGAMTDLLMAGCWGAMVGGVLQFAVQLPFVVRHLEAVRISFRTRVAGVREAIRAVGPVVAGRGVAQVSGYLDLFLASLLAVGAQSALRYAQLFYYLPISLFGMSVAASELPELSRLTEEKRTAFAARLRRSLRQVAFLTVPTVVGYLAFGYVIVGALLRTGQFQASSNGLVALVLAGYAVGILATTLSRLLQNAFYAVGDTKTPARTAVVRVVTSTVIAAPVMFILDEVTVRAALGPAMAGEPLYLGAVGLSVGSSVGAWVELGVLLRALRGPMPDVTLPWGAVARMTGVALGSTLPAAALWAGLPAAWPLWLTAAAVLPTFAGTYLAIAYATGSPELEAWVGRLM